MNLAILQLYKIKSNKLNAFKMLMDRVNQLQGEAVWSPSYPQCLPQQLNQHMGFVTKSNAEYE
ncbi:hypothetical protein NC651_019327 [Populus alba x Populus x berolinensis]|nr:hypothetical protein NC651_019327 [Populus alba x Populus x berolinensis]